MMAATANKFVRRTTLHEDEYRRNFRQIDNDVIEFLKSKEAKKVTRQMGTLYLALISAPSRFWEREGVLRFSGVEDEDDPRTAWQQLVSLLDCGNMTAKKALDWMHMQGIIGYHAGKNGVGIRIFLNRAASSIGKRGGQKNLHLVPTPVPNVRAPETGTPFKGCLENLELDKEIRTRETVACEPPPNGKPPNQVSEQPRPTSGNIHAAEPKASDSHFTNNLSGEAIVERIRREVASQVRAASAREHERTREWFINYALPKAMRLGQRSAYDVLRSYGALSDKRPNGRQQMHPDNREVGRHNPVNVIPRPISEQEITELAESCVALLLTQGQPIERTISEMMSQAGGFLLPEDASKVRAQAESLTRASVTTQRDGGERNGL